jgi:hypothetical protein
MYDYKPKKKGEIKKEVDTHIQEVKEYNRRTDNTAEDSKKISDLFKQLRGNCVTLDGAVDITKAMQNVCETIGKYHDRLGENLEVKIKQAGKTAKELGVRTRNAEGNTKKEYRTQN